MYTNYRYNGHVFFVSRDDVHIVSTMRNGRLFVTRFQVIINNNQFLY